MSGTVPAKPLKLSSVVIPAREDGCIASKVERRVHNILHEIVVVDDGITGPLDDSGTDELGPIQ